MNQPEQEIVSPLEETSGISFNEQDPNKLTGLAKVYQKMFNQMMEAQANGNMQQAENIYNALRDLIDSHGETLVVKDGPIHNRMTFWDDGSVG